jgi:hypothetical protein
LKKIKFPSEFPRTQRSIENFNIYKANEYRNLLFYSLINILKPFLPHEYYQDFLLYVLFMRILTQDEITNYDIEFAKNLIDEFLSEFEELYKEDNLSFNLHAHMHPPSQVAMFGPLHKVSCLSFEGVFKVCKDLFSGTRGISQQIAKNLNLSSFLYFNSENIFNKISS